MEENKYKIPKEVYDWFNENGCIYSAGEKSYSIIPFWYEMIEQGIVKFHHFDNLPKNVKEVHDEIVKPNWKDAIINPPTEDGRYWCYVKEIGELGLCHFEWNCYYDKSKNEFRDKHEVFHVTHWTELMGQPK